MDRPRGVVLYSGGLDSLLAARVLKDQGLEIIGFNCILPFVKPDIDPKTLRISLLAGQISLDVEYFRCGKDYLDILRKPRYGYGKHINPCIDCKIYFIRKAAEFMKSIGAEFVATGEVVGQRPMSQLKNTLNLIEKESGIKGRLLRPLSARLLKPTIPEMEGVVNREMLLDFSGRSRKRQMELAGKYGINEFSSPAGGCLLTDRYIAERVRDLFMHHEEISISDIYLLTIGRHFRLSDNAKIIVTRNGLEHDEMVKYRDFSDLFFVPDFKGPSVFVKGLLRDEELALVCRIINRYGRPESGESAITVTDSSGVSRKLIYHGQALEEELDKMRI
ncbi:MAG: tRNA 4-thiouridine(8) synthase ThiI [Spirochaetes bacterium]|jgi:tRNA(Ile)-lysidine synthase TilS/MesJ|nr:tRNA 4-thiouridine(8) synthase ThiI [Spirochaetota bacterium]